MDANSKRSYDRTNRSNGSYNNKRPKIEDNCQPSRVLHMRSLPPCCESDVVLLTIPFGRVNQIVFAKKTYQALLEVENVEMAKAIMEFYSDYKAKVLGKDIVMQYSNHENLSTRDDFESTNKAIELSNKLIEEDQDTKNDAGNIPRVLHVVTEDRLSDDMNYLFFYNVFSQFGDVIKILMFVKNRSEHILVEFNNHLSAFVALLATDGLEILNFLKLKVEFSKIDELDIRGESDKCRDFLRNQLNDRESRIVNNFSWRDIINPRDNGRGGGGGDGRRSGSRDRDDKNITLAEAVQNLSRMPGGDQILSAFGLSRPSAMVGFVGSDDRGHSRYDDGGGRRSDSRHDMMDQRYDRNSDDKPVIIVSNLNEDKVDVQKLFVLFGVYGDVVHVKIMYNKRDTALIQFQNGDQASTAMANLNNIKAWGNEIKVNISKHNFIQIPRRDSDESYTKDFTHSRLHRFKNPDSKNFRNIFPPGAILHLSNIPSDYGENDIRELFEQNGFKPQSFRDLSREGEKRKMTLVELSDADEAIDALTTLHDRELSTNAHLRVAFSKQRR